MTKLKEALKKDARPNAPSYLPSGFHTVTAHLTVSGAAQYIEFLTRAFHAVELSRSALPDGRLLNSSIRVGDSVLIVDGQDPSMSAIACFIS